MLFQKIFHSLLEHGDFFFPGMPLFFVVFFFKSLPPQPPPHSLLLIDWNLSRPTRGHNVLGRGALEGQRRRMEAGAVGRAVTVAVVATAGAGVSLIVSPGAFVSDTVPL